MHTGIMLKESGTYYIVISDEPISDDALEKIKPSFDAHRLQEGVVLLYTRSDVPTNIPSELLGFGGATAGVVFKLNGSYAGHYYKSLWDWLDEE